MGFKGRLKDLRLEYRNSLGKKVNGKYLIIESDDWGSIRQPSVDVWKQQLERIPETHNDPFFYYDSLESNRDMERVFDVLSTYKDIDGNHPIITCDYAVANPDFEKIYNSNFQTYYYTPFTKTTTLYSGSSRLIDLCKQGVDYGIWNPQLHCREHVQVKKWMEALRKGHPQVRWAFDHQMISTANVVAPDNHYAYMDAFNYGIDDTDVLQCIVKEAADLFEMLFGYRSKTFVASCYVWNEALEKALITNGIKYMQGGWYQWIPSEENLGYFNKKIHYNGSTSANQHYFVRNCLFEHSLFGDEGCVESCLKEIDSAFRWHQPAIISSHRVNYMSRLVQKNGENGVKLLDDLLKQIVNRWPDVKFISSDRLADIYNAEG